MTDEIKGLNEESFLLVTRLFEEYRTRKQHARSRHLLESPKKNVPILIEGPTARHPEDPDVVPLDDLLTTIDDDDKREEFKEFTQLLPAMVQYRSGLLTGLDRKTIDDALTKDVTNGQVMSYIAGEISKSVSSAASDLIDTVGKWCDTITFNVGHYGRKVYHGFWPATYQEKAAWGNKVVARPEHLTKANGGVEFATGLTIAGTAYTSMMLDIIKAIQESSHDPNPQAYIPIVVAGFMVAFEGAIRFDESKKGITRGTLAGYLISIPDMLKSWYHEKKTEVALSHLKIVDDEGKPMIGEQSKGKFGY